MALAQRWIKEIERSLKTEKGVASKITVGDVLRGYIELFDNGEFGRSKSSAIRALLSMPIADLPANRLRAPDLVDHANWRRELGAGPSTVKNDLIWLHVAYKRMRVARGLAIDETPIQEATELLSSERVIGKSKARSRRPTMDELDRLIGHYNRSRSTRGRLPMPMADVVLFALFSARRLSEITRIRWDGLSPDRSRVFVENIKHPTENYDVWVSLTPEATAVINRQPRVAPQIFPFNPKSISTSFTNTVRLLGIDDLRFHDLRHECTSWLFERGWDIPRVSGVTGHKSWSSLQRYTHLRDLGIKDKYDEWGWLPKSAD